MAITQMNQDLPQEFQNEAKKSLNSLQNFRGEISKDLDMLEAKAAEIKQKFEDNLHQEGLSRGFLMKPLEQYHRCLNFERQNLEKLLQEDEDLWQLNLREAEQRAREAQDKIRTFMERQ